ncbi:DDE-domain-containing protein, partial [Choiromyces venosus 120613-1]
VLLLDGYGSHCTKQFIDYCNERNIIPFCLPPHMTHLLQALDVIIFQPLKYNHAKVVEEATRTGCSDFNKIEFLIAIGSIQKQAFKRSTIISSFKKKALFCITPMLYCQNYESILLSPPVTHQKRYLYLELIGDPQPLPKIDQNNYFQCLKLSVLSNDMLISFGILIQHLPPSETH